MSTKLGRPPHEGWDELGFTRVKVYDKETKKHCYKAECWQCKKELSNTAGTRLLMHRKSCALDIVTMQSQQVSQNKDEMSNKRKTRESSCGVSSTDNSINEQDNSMTLKKQDVVRRIPKLRKLDKSLTKYIDEINEDDISLINQAILEYFIVSGTEFDTVNSKAFVNLMHRLRPAFSTKIPTVEVLTNQTLQEVYNNKTNLSKPFKSCGVLLVNGDVDSKMSVTYNNSGEFSFVRYNTNEDVKLFINNSVELLEGLSCRVKSVVSNVVSDNHMPLLSYNSNGDFFINVVCTSRYIFSSIREIVSPELLDKIWKINTTFNVKSLVDKYKLSFVNFHTGDYTLYYTGVRNCLENLDKFTDIVSKKLYSCDSTVLELLFNNDFTDELKETACVLESLDNLLKKRNVDYKLSDLVQDWLSLINETLTVRFQTILIDHGVSICNGAALAANFLHPNYRGILFAEKNHYLKVKIDFMIKISDQEELTSFFKYRDREDVFETLYGKQICDAKVFWKTAELEHKKLSRLALRLLEIPAFTYHGNFQPFSRQCINSIDKNKLTELYYMLKIND